MGEKLYICLGVRANDEDKARECSLLSMVYRRMGQNKDWIWRLLYLRSALSYSPGGKHLVCFQQRAAGRILRGFNQGVLNSSAPDVPQP